MDSIVIEFTSSLPCDDKETRDWAAWNNLMPPKPDDFHTVGEVKVSNAGITALLTPVVPQGINPTEIDLELQLTQHQGHWKTGEFWISVRYDKVLQNSAFSVARVRCGEKVLTTIKVEDVH